jgi:hypothetical protein
VVAATEELFKGWAKTFQDHDSIFTLGSKPTNRGDTRASSKVFVNTYFVVEVLAIGRFKLDSDFFL